MDSIVLSHALKALGHEVILAHLNHNLRNEESDGDEQFVQKIAKEWGATVITQKIKLPKKGNLEANARTKRYAFLEEVRQQHDADFIAVGHHFDDQIETILMNRERGAGWRGERGMLVTNKNVIRPMLELTRRQIEAYAQQNELDFRQDSSNADLNFKRNHFRHNIIPTLKKNPDFEASFRQSIQQASEQLRQLEQGAKEWLKSNQKSQCFLKSAFHSCEVDLQMEILIQLLGPRNLYGKTLHRLIDHIKNGLTGKKLTVKGVTFWVEPELIRLQNTPPDPLPEIWIEGKIEWGDYKLENKTGLRLKVRPWQPGDRFQPAGMQGYKKLQDFFVDAKIPSVQKHCIPIVVDEKGQIVCVGNLRFSERFKGLSNALKITPKRK